MVHPYATVWSRGVEGDMAESGISHTERNVELPPGQYRIDGFPRFGAHLNQPPPEVPDNPRLEITGAVTATTSVALGELASHSPTCTAG
jgi:hypothetical protein